MKSRIVGLLILIAVIAAGIVIYFMNGGGRPAPTMLKGFIGGEKEGFFEDAGVKELLQKKYGLKLDYAKAGSIDMARTPGDSDFLFPSSQIALEIYKGTQGNPLVRSEPIFNSPLVIYSWDTVTDALVKQGIVEEKNGVYSITDFSKLVQWTIEGKKWADVGLTDLYGSIKINTTDPAKSNSGNMFFALLAGMLNHGEVVDNNTLWKVLPQLKGYYYRLGYMEDSSSKLFDAYLTKGVGEQPMIAGYENQIIEFAAQNPEQWNSIGSRIRILYPVPTIWSSHILITVKDQAAELARALTDAEAQKIAWERHGFRSGVTGTVNDPKSVMVPGIAEKTDMVMPMPRAEVVEKILEDLQQQ